ncbi:methyltransferase domain-containing protein [Psychroserpens mesophilus]|uniref:methyltransferase domain-containing protein n=1 Tax=Psychroserpens mesophilus TaxID=325473 RepID=UPI003D64A837
MFKKIIKKLKRKNQNNTFLNNGKIPWSEGYHRYKRDLITKNINDKEVLDGFSKRHIPSDFGHRVDERIVEYPWIFANLTNAEERLLDAGSTFNFDFIINHDLIKKKNLTIYTFSPEKNCFNNKGVSYVYGDLRKTPFKDAWFDTIVSQSTIEHIDMDNSIYGYDIPHNKEVSKKSYEYIEAVKEMLRVLKSKGTLLITFPYGKFENHGFFQQFDEEMLNRLLEQFDGIGQYECTFFRYAMEGWKFCEKDELKEVVSYNPHTGKGKQDDNAAHCRSVVCINFTKF